MLQHDRLVYRLVLSRVSDESNVLAETISQHRDYPLIASKLLR